MSCPICEKDSNIKYKPFCSRRCADVDLAKWLGGGYSIASSSEEDAEEAAEAMERLWDEAARGQDEKLH